MKVKINFYLNLIFFIHISLINSKINKINLETNDLEITSNYHPLRIKFDYKILEINENKKNSKYIEKNIRTNFKSFF